MNIGKRRRPYRRAAVVPAILLLNGGRSLGRTGADTGA